MTGLYQILAQITPILSHKKEPQITQITQIFSLICVICVICGSFFLIILG